MRRKHLASASDAHRPVAEPVGRVVRADDDAWANDERPLRWVRRGERLFGQHLEQPVGLAGYLFGAVVIETAQLASLILIQGGRIGVNADGRDEEVALDPRVERYLFISTISVYADPTALNQDETGELSRLDDDSAEEVTGETYGLLKVLAEEALAAAYPPERTLVVRPGIIVGPDDPTDRFSYWPVRVARGGEVLAPHGPSLPIQWIDVRDLATWLVSSLERGLAGTYNAVSEAGQFTLGQVLESSKTATGSGAEIIWVDEEFLIEQGVQPFAGLPLWFPGELANMWSVDGSRAHIEGLRIRPVEETVAATLEWHESRGAPELKFGMSIEREREVLEAWRRTEGS